MCYLQPLQSCDLAKQHQKDRNERDKRHRKYVAPQIGRNFSLWHCVNHVACFPAKIVCWLLADRQIGYRCI